mmetsp:Transcript_29538/g.90571  ORF Transcript_29538/g.90571 Transcript_29538/m.90571 type:complete len:291 (-) Transcript_29538:2020-2892(-)
MDQTRLSSTPNWSRSSSSPDMKKPSLWRERGRRPFSLSLLSLSLPGRPTSPLRREMVTSEAPLSSPTASTSWGARMKRWRRWHRWREERAVRRLCLQRRFSTVRAASLRRPSGLRRQRTVRLMQARYTPTSLPLSLSADRERRPSHMRRHCLRRAHRNSLNSRTTSRALTSAVATSRARKSSFRRRSPFAARASRARSSQRRRLRSSLVCSLRRPPTSTRCLGSTRRRPPRTPRLHPSRRSWSPSLRRSSPTTRWPSAARAPSLTRGKSARRTSRMPSPRSSRPRSVRPS